MSTLHRYVSQLMVVLGIVITLLSYFADQIGLGTWPGLGTRHLVGMLFGMLLLVNGVTIWAIRERG